MRSSHSGDGFAGWTSGNNFPASPGESCDGKRSHEPARNIDSCGRHRTHQSSVCTEISSASSTSMPRYLIVLSILLRPSSNWTALRFFVRL